MVILATEAHSIDSRCTRLVTGAKVAKWSDTDKGAILTSMEWANFSNRSTTRGEVVVRGIDGTFSVAFLGSFVAAVLVVVGASTVLEEEEECFKVSARHV